MIENKIKTEYTDGFFNVGSEHGFLPISAPLEKLPDTYVLMQTLLDNFPTVLDNENVIMVEINKIPNYLENIKLETDIFILQALYRAYCFLASGYLLESCHAYFKKNQNVQKSKCPFSNSSLTEDDKISDSYGEARRVLPENISVPFVYVANKLDAKPFLDYHYAYSLGNYVKKDKNGDLHWKNLDMACKFSGTSDEIGFIMVHVYINELSPKLIDSVHKILNDNDYVGGLKQNYHVMQEINIRRREMWNASRCKNYIKFRGFLMGIKGNHQMFGEGVVYEGEFDNEPQQYRGQTGAQDDIIPMEDIMTGLINYYPENELTSYLIDLRSYRPTCVQEFFSDLQNATVSFGKMGLMSKLLQNNDHDALVYLACVVNEIYLFRNGHWQFVQKYILDNTKYAFATGGTPITTWLPNQINACLLFQTSILEAINNAVLTPDTLKLYEDLKNAISAKYELLRLQEKELSDANYNIDRVYGANDTYGLDDTKN